MRYHINVIFFVRYRERLLNDEVFSSYPEVFLNWTKGNRTIVADLYDCRLIVAGGLELEQMHLADSKYFLQIW